MLEENRIWYLKTYENLITKALSRGLDKSKLGYYTEKHHIVPRCIWPEGEKVKSNLVLLTAREHIIAHMLLSNMYPDNLKLAHAVTRLTSFPKGSFTEEGVYEKLEAINKTSTRLLAYYREKSIELIKATNTGRKKSEKTLEKLKNSLKTFNENNPGFWVGKRKHSDEWKNELSLKWKGSNNPNFGGITELHRKHLSESHFNTSPNRKKVKDINTGKLYNSIAECARDLNKPESTLKYWIKNHPEKGFKIIE